MGKTWISVGCAFVASLSIGCASAPKPPPEPPPKEEEPEPAQTEDSAPQEESQEEVCDKMWSIIEVEAEDAAKAKKKGKKAKLPTEADKQEFLEDCVERGTKQKQEEPERYECMRVCIMESISTKEVETCAKDCP